MPVFVARKQLRNYFFFCSLLILNICFGLTQCVFFLSADIFHLTMKFLGEALMGSSGILHGNLCKVSTGFWEHPK